MTQYKRERTGGSMDQIFSYNGGCSTDGAANWGNHPASALTSSQASIDNELSIDKVRKFLLNAEYSQFPTPPAY
jgi:hypothetical protein